MPITGRKPSECFRRFETHVRQLVAATVSPTHQIHAVYLTGEPRAALSFREGDGAVAIPLKTDAGKVYFHLSQSLDAVEEYGRYRLQTRQYAYRLQNEPSLTAQAAVRWEYERDAPRDGWCRHHVQLPRCLALGGRELSLNKAHLPSGWITMEEVIRFLIVELSLKPLCGDDWPMRLEKSEQSFFEKFRSKRHVPPKK